MPVGSSLRYVVLYPICIQNLKNNLDKIRVSSLIANMPWKRVRANGTITWYTRFRHRRKKICVPTRAKTEDECREIEEKMKRDMDLGVENGHRRGPLLTKLACDYVQWLLTYRSQEHAMRIAAALGNTQPKSPVKHIQKLKPGHVRRYIDHRRREVNQKLADKPISERTIDIEVGSLRSMVNSAVKQQRIPPIRSLALSLCLSRHME